MKALRSSAVIGVRDELAGEARATASDDGDAGMALNPPNSDGAPRGSLELQRLSRSWCGWAANPCRGRVAADGVARPPALVAQRSTRRPARPVRSSRPMAPPPNNPVKVPLYWCCFVLCIVVSGVSALNGSWLFAGAGLAMALLSLRRDPRGETGPQSVVDACPGRPARGTPAPSVTQSLLLLAHSEALTGAAARFWSSSKQASRAPEQRHALVVQSGRVRLDRGHARIAMQHRSATRCWARASAPRGRDAALAFGRCPRPTVSRFGP